MLQITEFHGQYLTEMLFQCGCASPRIPSNALSSKLTLVLQYAQRVCVYHVGIAHPLQLFNSSGESSHKV